MWYANRYRRHLCDMHIEDWDKRFLSEFSPETYIENLKAARINNAMLYLQSHVGLCYYPTKTGKMHSAFEGRESLMRDLVNLCHQNDIKVTGYYSINYNTAEHDRHPEWRMLNEQGKSRRESGAEEDTMAFASKKAARYGLCCPNNQDYRAFVYAQIDEMLEYFELDALFFDMPFWPHTCYCPQCRARWEQEMGGTMPVDPKPETEDYNRLTLQKYKWMGEWAQSITAHVKARAPEMPVEFNYASGIAGDSSNGCGQEVNLASDYAGGDLYGGMLEHSFTCKFYRNATRNQPFEYMFSRCKPALRVHTLTKTLDEMKTSVAVTAAHHGATLVIDAIDPVGTMDRRVYERFGKMFDFQKPYEPYFRGQMKEDVGIYYGIRSKTSRHTMGCNSKNACVSAAAALSRSHILYGVTGCFHDLTRYPVLIAPMLSAMEDDNERLIRYVEEGGILYLSGADNRDLVQTLTGGKLTGMTENDTLYIAPKKEYEPLFGWFNEQYPLPYDGYAPVMTGIDPAYVAAALTLPYTSKNEMRFASIHSDPPGIPTEIPMLVIRPYGKGTVIWSAACIEGVAMDEYRDIFMNLLFTACGSLPFSLHSDAPANVEFTLFENEGEKLVTAVNMCNDASVPTLPGFEVRVRTEKQPCEVLLLPERTPVPFAYENGETVFHTRNLHIWDMYQIVK